MHANTQLNPADETNNSASIAIHIPANDEQQMQIRKVRWDDTTQFRVSLHHLAHRFVLKRGNWGAKTGSHPDRISKSAKSKRSDFRRQIYRVSMEERARSAAWISHKSMYTFQVRILRIGIDSSNQVPRAMLIHLL